MGFTLDGDQFSEATVSSMKNCLQLFLFNYRAFVVMQIDGFFSFMQKTEREVLGSITYCLSRATV